MKLLFPLLLLTLLLPLAEYSLSAQSLVRRLQSEHGQDWTDRFGTADWKNVDIGFVVVKHEMMLYVIRQDGRRDTVASFPVCAMDRVHGFKQREGDGKTPEGIYHISLLNPYSSYHLSMKINYPNRVDNRRHARHTRAAGERWSQGGDIFIHGNCVSIGCLAMTDSVIEKLYLLIAARARGKQDIPVLILPYDDAAHYQQMQIHADEQYEGTGEIHWLLLRDHLENMSELWRYFNMTGMVPKETPTPIGQYRVPEPEQQ